MAGRTWSIDQERLSGANLEGDWQGATIRGFQKIDMNEEVSREPMYGNSGISIGMPGGSIKGGFTLETIPEEAMNIMAAHGNNYSKIAGSIGISLYEPIGGNMLTVTLTRVYIQKISLPIEAGGSKGTTATIEAIVLDPIDWDGLTAISDASSSSAIVDLGVAFGI